MEKFADKLVLRTILYELEDSDAKKFLQLVSEDKFEEAEKLVEEKIPDLEEKVKNETQRRLANIGKD